jgi:hypothetical protein
MGTFRETGNILKCISMGRLSMSAEKVKYVHEAYERSLGNSVCTMAKQLCMSRATGHIFLHLCLYKHEVLLSTTYNQKVYWNIKHWTIEYMLAKLNENPGFLQIIFLPSPCSMSVESQQTWLEHGLGFWEFTSFKMSKTRRRFMCGAVCYLKGW